jgi:hypothetical protein
MLEATIALSLLLMGLLGMGALAMATIRSNIEAQDHTRATNLADRIIEMIRTESLGWNNGAWTPGAETPAQATFFPLMSVLPAGVVGPAGFREFSHVLAGGGAYSAFDIELDPVDLAVAANAARAKYCVHYDMTWLQPNETVRADVRVYWMRRGSPPDLFGARCGDGNIDALAINTTNVRCVGRTALIMRNDAGDVL